MVETEAVKRVELVLSRGGDELIDVTFRPALEADVPAMHELSEPFADRGWLIGRDREMFANGDDFYVLEAERKVVACAGIRRFDGCAEIFNVAVSEKLQGMGLGRFLIAAVLVVLDAEGFGRAFIYSRTASRWFESLGFAPVDPATLPAERLRTVDPERRSVPMARATVRAIDGVDALPELTEVSVRCTRSGVELPWRGTVDSLLPFAEKNGIEVDSLCWSGVCGTCSTRIDSGSLAYHFTPEVEPPPGHVLLCIGRPLTSVVLDL